MLRSVRKIFLTPLALGYIRIVQTVHLVEIPKVCNFAYRILLMVDVWMRI